MVSLRPMLFIPKGVLRYDKETKKVYMEVSVERLDLVFCKDCMYWHETGEGIGECESLEVADSDPEITHAVQTTHDWFCANCERATSLNCGAKMDGGENDAGK